MVPVCSQFPRAQPRAVFGDCATAVLLLVLASCSPQRDAGNTGRRDLHDSLDVASMTYAGIEEADGPVALADGRWEGAPFDSGAASRPSVRLVRTLSPQGDLDGDGEPEFVALLAASAGGTGSQLYAAVVARRDGRWQNVATAPVGDRVDVRDALVAARRLALDVVQAGPEDALCCPGELATRTWELHGDSLVELPARVTGRMSPAVLESGEWMLSAWSFDEPAPAEPVVTLRAVEGRWAGSLGCNRYTLEVAPGEMPGEVKLGAAAGTRMACPDPAGAIEARYLQALAGVTRFQFIGGRLALFHESDEVSGVLLFERRPTP